MSRLEILQTTVPKIYSQAVNVTAAAQQICQALQEALEVQECVFVFLDAAHSFQLSNRPAPFHLSAESQIVIWLRKNTETPVVRSALHKNSPASFQKMKQEMDASSIALAFPIADAQQQLIGILLVSSKKSKKSFTAQEIKAAQIFLRQMSLVLYNVRKQLVLQKKIESGEGQYDKEFTTGLFHEVRTPLTIAQSSVEALQWTTSPKERQEYIRKASEQIQKSSHVLAEVVDIMALEQGKTQLQFTHCSLGVMLQHALDKNAALLKEKSIRIIRSGEKYLRMSFWMDSTRMTKVLDRLIHNAAFFQTKKKGGWMKINCQRNKSALRCTLQDNGPGMATKDVSRVSEKFYKIDAARNIHRGGPGLGLAYARAVIEAHNGHMVVTSAPAQGTTVTLELPLHQT